MIAGKGTVSDRNQILRQIQRAGQPTIFKSLRTDRGQGGGAIEISASQALVIQKGLGPDCSQIRAKTSVRNTAGPQKGLLANRGQRIGKSEAHQMIVIHKSASADRGQLRCGRNCKTLQARPSKGLGPNLLNRFRQIKAS